MVGSHLFSCLCKLKDPCVVCKAIHYARSKQEEDSPACTRLLSSSIAIAIGRGGVVRRQGGQCCAGTAAGSLDWLHQCTCAASTRPAPHLHNVNLPTCKQQQPCCQEVKCTVLHYTYFQQFVKLLVHVDSSGAYLDAGG